MNFKFLLSTLVLGLLSLCLTAQNCAPPPTAIDNILILSTQAEVDDFGPCSFFQGSITIDGSGINNIQALAGLQEISEALIIQNTGLTNLQGLEALKIMGSDTLVSMSGNLSIDDNPNLVDVTALNNIENVNNGLIRFSYNSSLVDINTLNNLPIISNSLEIRFNDNLESISGFGSLISTPIIQIKNNPSLSYCCGVYNAILEIQASFDLTINNNVTGCNTVSEIAAACNTTGCYDVTHPGIIGYDHSVCYPGDTSDLLVNVQSPTGGTGVLEYMWMYTTDDPTAGLATWIPIPDSNAPDYQPGPIYETTWFVRCVRRAGCTDWSMESNSVRVCLDLYYPVVEYSPSDDTIQCYETPYFGYPEFTDDCDEDLTFNYQVDSIPYGCLYKWVKTWYATDDCDRTTMTTQTIYVVDTENPYFTYTPNDTIIQCDQNPYDYFVPPIAKDHCDPYPDLTYTTDSTVNTCIKTYVRTWTATDNCYNYATYSQTITTIDTIAPYIYLNAPYHNYYSGDTLTVECDNAPAFNPNSVNVYDNCDPYPTVDFFEIAYPGDCLVDGYKRLMKCWWVATDECDNSRTFTIYVKIVDTTKPTFSYVPPNFEMDCPGNPIFGVPTYYDNCPGDLTLTHYVDTIINQLDCYHKYICTWRVTDMCGNYKEAIQIITAQDDEAPIFEQFYPITGTDCYSPLVITPPLVSDNCDTNPEVWYTIDTIPDNYFVRYKIYWHAEDNCYNTADTFQIVSVPCNTNFLITNFETTLENEESVLLEWKVKNERPEGIYLIERSKNGEDFEIIADEIIAVSGLQDEAVEYSFVDEQPMNGYNFYQIRYFDTEGTTKKSTQEEIVISTQSAASILTYPNPVKDILQVELLKDSEDMRQISIYDTAGRLVLQKEVEQEEAVLSLDVSDLYPAIYLLVLTTENSKMETRRIIIGD